jgi:hypothetical protein
LKKLVPSAILAALALAGLLLLSDLGGSVRPSEAASGFRPGFASVQRDKGPVFRQGCLVVGSTVRSGPCVYGNPESDKVVVVFGDSHALQWTPPLLRIAQRRDWRVIALLRGNCTPALARIDAQCDRWRQHSLRRIRSVKPSLVILGTNTGKKVQVRKNGRLLNRRASDRVLQAGMARTMRKLLNLGADVTLMRDLVLAPFTPSDCVRQNPRRPAKCAFRAKRPFWLSFDFKAARRMSRVQMIDPLPKVCPRNRCTATSGRILKFRDRFHISATYAATLTNWLERRLQNP